MVQVVVRDNNVDQALKALKKKMQREGVFREMKLRRNFEKPSEKKPAKRRKPFAAPASWNANVWNATDFKESFDNESPCPFGQGFLFYSKTNPSKTIFVT